MIIVTRSGHEILIDDADAQGKFLVAIGSVQGYIVPAEMNWEIKKHGNTHYASVQISRRGVRRRFMLHRILTSAAGGTVVDHVNHNGLDNRRVNLRVCTPQENQRNRLVQKNKSHKGVSFHRVSGKFEAFIKIDGTKKHLGLFPTAGSAASAYDDEAIKQFGQFALTNKGVIQ